jgi:PAS domain S-box-containing protein
MTGIGVLAMTADGGSDGPLEKSASVARAVDELEWRLAAIVESSDDAIISKNLDGIILTWNTGATRLFGYTPEEAVGRSVTMLIPEDRENEEPEILARLRRGERMDHYETVRRRKDGSLVDISLTVSPIKDSSGVVIGASKIARDITDRKKLQEQQTLLLREMSHRVNNLLTVTRSIVALTARSSATPEEMAQAITGRIDALASAHRLACPESHEPDESSRAGTTLDQLIRAIAAPYGDPGQKRRAVILAEGPEVFVHATAVSPLSLVLHELATNAAKYGALSSPASGRVRIVWTVKNGRLFLDWRESGGPAADRPPGKKGFGTLLVDGAIKKQLRGEVDYDWLREGLVIRLSVPLESLTLENERPPG